jgi:hypothetical protein
MQELELLDISEEVAADLDDGERNVNQSISDTNCDAESQFAFTRAGGGAKRASCP